MEPGVESSEVEKNPNEVAQSVLNEIKSSAEETALNYWRGYSERYEEKRDPPLSQEEIEREVKPQVSSVESFVKEASEACQSSFNEHGDFRDVKVPIMFTYRKEVQERYVVDKLSEPGPEINYKDDTWMLSKIDGLYIRKNEKEYGNYTLMGSIPEPVKNFAKAISEK